jgi:hypothetical protein
MIAARNSETDDLQANFGADTLVTFSNLEVAKLTAGVIFSGISPIAVAEAVNAELEAQAAADGKSP